MPEPREFVVMFSSGAGSWAAARRIADERGPERMTLLFSDTRQEDEDNYRFLTEAAGDIGAPLVTLTEGRDVWQVFNDQRFIGNTRVSNCSRTLKQEPARKWLAEHADPESASIVVGIDWTEIHRLPKLCRSYAPYPVLAPLCEPPYLERADIFAMLAERGIARPRLYDMGFAHANCGGFCVRAGHGQFAQLLQVMPARFAEHEEAEEKFRANIGKDVSILRERSKDRILERLGLSPGDVSKDDDWWTVTATGEPLPRTLPLTLTALRERYEATPEQLDMFDLGGCGCMP